MGKKDGLQGIMSWEATVSSLQAAGAEVHAHCSKCGVNAPVDLGQVAADPRMGPLFSFWDRRPPCRSPGCGYPVFFVASRPGAGVWPTHMRHAYPSDLDRVTRAWRASLPSGLDVGDDQLAG